MTESIDASDTRLHVTHSAQPCVFVDSSTSILCLSFSLCSSVSIATAVTRSTVICSCCAVSAFSCCAVSSARSRSSAAFCHAQHSHETQ